MTFDDWPSDYTATFPSDWSVKKLKRLFTVGSGDFLSPNDESDEGYPVYGGNGIRGYAEKPNCDGETLLIGRVGAHCGNVHLVDGKFWYSEHALRVFPRSRFNNRFMRFLIQVVDLNRFASRTAQPLINGKTVQERCVGVPPIDEQQRIADYLDASCEAIDRAVETKQKQLDTLDALRKSIIQKAVTQGLNPNVPMKDSGIQYLGKVPSTWRIKKLCRLLAEPMTYGLNEPGTDDNPENPRYIRITDFGSDGQLRDETFRSLPPEVARGASLREGDLLFARSGATVGKSFLFTGYEGEACYAGYLIKANTLRHLLDPRFLYAFTKSLSYESWKDLIFTQATIQNISATKYAYLEVPLPTLEEQQNILEYLDHRLRHQQSVVTTIQNQIDTLNAYRKSLIHECVTGKRRISDDDIAKVKSHV